MNFSCKSGEHRLFLRPQKVQQTKQNAFWAKRGLGTTADPTGVTLLLQVCCLALCRYCLLQSHWSQNMAGSWEWHSYIMDLSASVFKQDVIAFHALLQATLLLFASGAGEEKGVCWVQANSRGNSCESLSNKGDLVIWQIWIEERDVSQFLKLVIVMWAWWRRKPPWLHIHQIQISSCSICSESECHCALLTVKGFNRCAIRLNTLVKCSIQIAMKWYFVSGFTAIWSRQLNPDNG